METRSILIVHPSNDWYGSDRMLVLLARQLIGLGYRVRVLLPESGFMEPSRLEVRLDALGVTRATASFPVLRRRLITLRGLIGMVPAVLRFPFWIRRFSAVGDLIILNTSAVSLLAPVCRLMGRHVVGYLHETPTRREAVVLSMFWFWSTRLIFISHAVAAAFPQTIRRRGVVLHNSVERPTSRTDPVGTSTLELLFIGRLTERKGIRQLIDAVSNAGRSDMRLTVIGGPATLGVDFDFAQLLASMESSGVRFLGEVAEPEPYIRACDVVVVPSVQAEGLGLTAIEALANGRPVVSTRIGGLDEVIDESVGWLLDPHDPESWAKTLSKISQEEARGLEVACRRRFEERFSEERFTSELKGFLLSLQNL